MSVDQKKGLALSPPVAPISRQVLAIELADRVREMILEGVLVPGEKVPEKALTERFGVSRTPLREALKVLAAEGLIELIPNRGAIIAHQTDAELQEVFPILAVLEGLAGELAALTATDGEISHVMDLTRDLHDSFSQSDRPAYFAINQSIHAAILTASRNDSLIRAHALLAQRIQRARYQANLTSERWKQAVMEHDQIARALCTRDPSTLGRIMRAHLMNKLHALVPNDPGEDGSPPPTKDIAP